MLKLESAGTISKPHPQCIHQQHDFIKKLKRKVMFKLQSTRPINKQHDQHIQQQHDLIKELKRKVMLKLQYQKNTALELILIKCLQT